MKNLTTITLHGVLGKQVGETWNLQVKSVSEAVHAVNILSNRKLYQNLYENDRKNIKYKVLVDNNLIDNVSHLKPEDIEEIKSSEFCIEKGNMKTIDIVPVIEGAAQGKAIGAIVGGVVLIIVGVVLSIFGYGIGTPLIIAGLGLIAAGIFSLLSKPPEFEDFREPKGRISYLFGGPVNVIREGGPVPIGYGRLIVGSQIVGATFEVSDVSNDSNTVPTKPQPLTFNPQDWNTWGNATLAG